MSQIQIDIMRSLGRVLQRIVLEAPNYFLSGGVRAEGGAGAAAGTTAGSVGGLFAGHISGYIRYCTGILHPENPRENLDKNNYVLKTSLLFIFSFYVESVLLNK